MKAPYISWILLTTLMLFGCSASQQQDGPPSYYVNVNKIPNTPPTITSKTV